MENIRGNLISIKPSATLTINEFSKKLEKEGKKIYKFGLGQSPFPVPDIVVKELKLNAHQKDYINVSGLLELREKIAEYHSKKNKHIYYSDNVIIGPGSKELIFQSQLTIKGDVLLPSPSWVSYAPQAKIIKKNIHWLKTSAETNWHLTPEILDKKCKQLKNKKKLLILNSPNNPSGTVIKDLKDIAQVAKKYNLIILSDEIYAELDYTGKYKSITHYYPEKTIISSGISKWCGAGGWRLGTLVFPKELNQIKNIIRSIASETYTSVSAPIQYAAIKAYSENHQNYLDLSRKILKYIGIYIYKELNSVGIKCQKPQGGFYMLCDFSKIISLSNRISDSPTLCKTILNDIGFAMLPGCDFGIDKKKLITRIAFVDFDGKKALKAAKKNQNFDADYLKKVCPNIINGIKKLSNWIKSYPL